MPKHMNDNRKPREYMTTLWGDIFAGLLIAAALCLFLNSLAIAL